MEELSRKNSEEEKSIVKESVIIHEFSG